MKAGGGNGSQSVASTVLQERISLFNSRSRTAGKGARGRRAKRGNVRPRTWTAPFVCLADRYQTRIPTSTEKQILHQAGLGMKKIKLEASDSEEQVLQKIISDEQDENGQIVGFPQLKDCGGFEILHCVSNCKDLLPISCSWSVCDLKANLGPQTKLYLRPIQKNLSTKSSLPDNKCQVKEECLSCQKQVLVTELRQHMYACRYGNAVPLYEESGSDEDLPPFSLTQSQSTHISQAFPSNPSITSPQAIPAQTTPVQTTAAQTMEAQTIPVQNPPPTDASQQQMPDPLTEVIDVDQIISETTDTSSVEEVVEKVIDYCKVNQVSDPVEILRCLQNEVVIGRQLEIQNVAENIEGSTNYILVDRSNLLTTAFEELDSVDNYRFTLQVQFYGEVIFLYDCIHIVYSVRVLSFCDH